MKRWFFSVALCLCVCLLVGGLVGRAEAADIVASGGCGANLTWTLDSEGTLTIAGSGNMYSYGFNESPWSSRCNSVRSVVVKQGVTRIGNNAFSGCTGLTSITIPESVTSIGDDAFCNCSGLTSITIPDSVTSIGEYAFWYCSSLASIFFNGDAPTIATDAFSGVNAFAFYPAENTTWGSKKHNYGGTLY